MTKDEAREYLYSAIEEVALHLLSSNEAERAEAREFIDEHLDAFAQAHTDAALADTLTLLEVIAKVKDGRAMVWMGEEMVGVTYYGNGGFGYERSYYDGNMSHIQSCTRAEAEALLGEGKKE